MTRDPSAVRGSKTKHSKPPIKQAEHHHEHTATKRCLPSIANREQRDLSQRSHAWWLHETASMSLPSTGIHVVSTPYLHVPNTPARNPQTSNAQRTNPIAYERERGTVRYESLRAACRQRGGGGKGTFPPPPRLLPTASPTAHPPSPKVS